MKRLTQLCGAALVLSCTAAASTQHGYDYFSVRGGLTNARVAFERNRKGRVVFLGGSITNMKGWRDLVCDDLKRRFPQTEFEFVNAGIPSLGSVPGAFRFERDVLSRGPVDLLVEEAAVNDEVNGASDVEQVRGMEGIVRHARLANPNTDVLLLHFADPEKLEAIRRGETPAVIRNHERVADHYGVPSIDLAREVAARIDDGEFTWEKDFKDLHPAPFGQRLYARSIGRLFDVAWKGELPADAKVTPHALPAPLDEKSYFNGVLGDVHGATPGEGWKVEEKWEPAHGVHTRPGFVHVPVLAAERPGAECRYEFEGVGVGVFVVSGPDAGVVEYSVDGGEWKKRDLYTRWSKSLHLPWAQVLEGDLPRGRHVLALKVSPDRNPHSKGTAVRVVHFLVNR